jgi:8-oxo-dGTP pyrophosphatase MutT (NUDIX family)
MSIPSPFFRCSAAVALRCAPIPAAEFAARLLARDASGNITLSNTAQQQQQQRPSGDDRSAFSSRLASTTLCILPAGCDVVPISGMRWKGGPATAASDDAKGDGAGRFADGSRVSCLMPARGGDASKVFEISAGKLLVDGLDRQAEIVFDVPVSDSGNVLCAAYQCDGEGSGKHWPLLQQDQQQERQNPHLTVMGRYDVGPILVHACPCPLRYENYVMLAASKTVPRPAPSAEAAAPPASVPVANFVRKFASAVIVLCRVPKAKSTAADDGDQLKYTYYVVLTHRAPHLRVFPNFWVVPGGGFDASSDIFAEDAARREMDEEVALRVLADDGNESAAAGGDKSGGHKAVRTEFLGAWESCFPTHPDADEVVAGTATVRGHIVTFFGVLLECADESLLPQLKHQQEECTAALWFRVGPGVTNRARGCDFGPVPRISPFFEQEMLRPNLLGLTLEMRDCDVKAAASGAAAEAATNLVGQRMKITAGTEFFIQRAIERQIVLGEC